jgi:hypothetical protein
MSKSLDGVLIKKAYKPQQYTQKQLLEFAHCADRDTGPHYFLEHYFNIQHPTKGQMLYKPFDFQVGLVDNYHHYRFSINLLSRQMGKTTTAAGYLLWYAMFVPDSTILIAAHKYSGAQEIMQRVRYAYELMPDHIRAGVTNYNKGSIEFENGSRIVAQATTENTGRGMSISLLYCDEFAFVRNTIAREFWTAISPTLATGGKAIITSTPNSDEDQFWELWLGANKNLDEHGNETELGINGFRSYCALWHQHPDRDQAWADEERGRIGEERFRREMECEPIIFDETLIAPTALIQLEAQQPVEVTDGNVRWFDRPRKDRQYLIALDPSLGTGGDNAAIQVYEMGGETGMRQIAEWFHNRTPIRGQIGTLVKINRYILDRINNPTAIWYSIENNSLGEAGLVVIEDIGEENIPGMFVSEPIRKGHVRKFRRGFNTTHRSKLTACSKLKSWIETKRLHVCSKALITELKAFIQSSNSFSAKPGEHDDLVMSTVLAVRMAMQIQQYDADLDSQFKDDIDDYVEPMPFAIL